MTSQQENRLRELQLAFIGKLMAGLSHENKNHLAIIKESCGLIEDLLLLEEENKTLNPERYIKILSGINKRISQAAEMCRYLSSFSHRMDQPLSSFSTTEVLQEEIYLLHRFADQRQVEFALSSEENVPAVFNDPALLQFLVFCLVWPRLESLGAGGRILISVTPHGQAVRITIAIESPANENQGDIPWQEAVPAATDALGAEISRRAEPDNIEEIAVTVPSIE